MHYILGESECNASLVTFTRLQESMYDNDQCSWEFPPRCLSLPIESISLHLHYGVMYCVMLQLEGTTELSTFMQSTFIYHSGFPKIGTIVEIAPYEDISNMVSFHLLFYSCLSNVPLTIMEYHLRILAPFHIL